MKFPEWLLLGLFLMLVVNMIVGIANGSVDYAVTISVVTGLMGAIWGFSEFKEKPRDDGDR